MRNTHATGAEEADLSVRDIVLAVLLATFGGAAIVVSLLAMQRGGARVPQANVQARADGRVDTCRMGLATDCLNAKHQVHRWNGAQQLAGRVSR